MKETAPRTTRVRNLFMGVGLLALAALVSQCSDSTGPPPPQRISIVSGNNQWSLKGTEVPDPLVVVVVTESGSAAPNATVRFATIAGGGTVAGATVQTNDQGLAATRLTLGSTVGANRVTASIDGASVVFDATASNFLCQEAEDTLRVSYGTPGHVFLGTKLSSLFMPSGGIVRLNPFGAPPTAQEFVDLGRVVGVPPLIWDVAFSPRGDFYVACRAVFPEILKIDVGGVITKFASLEANQADDAVEITFNPIGLLVGVDKKGPFAIGCRDVMTRFPVATFTGGVNTDAVAVDPRRQAANPFGEDIYFIRRTDRTLYRLALDSMAVEIRGLEPVTQLTRAEADSANGMVCDGFDGTVYILVDTPATKQILAVTPAGAKTTFYNFLTDPVPPLPGGGAQRDLALRRPNLYTLDTLNDHLLVIGISGQFNALFADSLDKIKLSRPMDQGERVGLDALR